MKFQTTYRGRIDFDATYENLGKLGYEPKRHHSGRGGGQNDAGSLTFNLNSARVTISPKGDYHAIQVAWNSVEEMMKHEKKLLEILVFPSAYTKTLASVDFESKLLTINIQIPYDEKLLSKIDTAYSEYMKDVAKSSSLVDLFR